MFHQNGAQIREEKSFSGKRAYNLTTEDPGDIRKNYQSEKNRASASNNVRQSYVWFENIVHYLQKRLLNLRQSVSLITAHYSPEESDWNQLQR